MKEIHTISNMEDYFLTKTLIIFILVLLVTLGIVVTIASISFGIFYFAILLIVSISFISRFIERIE